jgi:hypothetical protein
LIEWLPFFLLVMHLVLLLFSPKHCSIRVFFAGSSKQLI